MISSGKVFIFCYLIFSPAVLSLTVPAPFQKYKWYLQGEGLFCIDYFRLFNKDDDVNRQGQFDQAADRTLEIETVRLIGLGQSGSNLCFLHELRGGLLELRHLLC